MKKFLMMSSALVLFTAPAVAAQEAQDQHTDPAQTQDWMEPQPAQQTDPVTDTADTELSDPTDMSVEPFTDRHDWVNRVVYDSNDERIGAVERVRLNASGEVDAIVVESGGVLDVGGREVLLEPNDYMLASVEGADSIRLNLTRDEFDSLPDFDERQASDFPLSSEEAVFGDSADKDESAEEDISAQYEAEGEATADYIDESVMAAADAIEDPDAAAQPRLVDPEQLDVAANEGEGEPVEAETTVEAETDMAMGADADMDHAGVDADATLHADAQADIQTDRTLASTDALDAEADERDFADSSVVDTVPSALAREDILADDFPAQDRMASQDVDTGVDTDLDTNVAAENRTMAELDERTGDWRIDTLGWAEDDWAGRDVVLNGGDRLGEIQEVRYGADNEVEAFIVRVHDSYGWSSETVHIRAEDVDSLRDGDDALTLSISEEDLRTEAEGDVEARTGY